MPVALPPGAFSGSWREVNEAIEGCASQTYTAYESPGILSKCRFWVTRSGLEPGILPLRLTSQQCWFCWSRAHTACTKVLGHLPLTIMSSNSNSLSSFQQKRRKQARMPHLHQLPQRIKKREEPQVAFSVPKKMTSAWEKDWGRWWGWCDEFSNPCAERWGHLVWFSHYQPQWGGTEDYKGIS